MWIRSEGERARLGAIKKDEALAEKDAEVFVTVGVGMIGAANCIDSLEVFAVAFAVAAQ